MSSTKWCCACAAVVAALVLPSAALAHVGKSALVATNFDARITGVQPSNNAVRAKVVDGDGQLWLDVSPEATVLIPGLQGEPFLRFDSGGVFVNLRSFTAESDRILRVGLRPDLDPHARPLWHRLSSGHSYLWHDHRLHAREPLARGHRGAAVLGHWSVPLLIDGRHHALRGELVYRPPGSAWPWILIAGALAAFVVGALAFSSSVEHRVAVTGALLAVPLMWTLRVGRELHGRPGVSVGGQIEIALTSLVGIALLYGLLHRKHDVRVFTAILAATVCVYEGLTMLPVLTHGVALTALPTTAARIDLTAVFGLSAGVLALTLRNQSSDRAEPSAGGQLSARDTRDRSSRPEPA
jgi:hypothetical protein